MSSKQSPQLPSEVISLITNQIELPTARLINQQSLKAIKPLYIKKLQKYL